MALSPKHLRGVPSRRKKEAGSLRNPPLQQACELSYSSVPLLSVESLAWELFELVSEFVEFDPELLEFEELFELLLLLELLEELLEELEDDVLSVVVGLGPRESVIWMLEPFSREPEVGYWRMTEPAATVLEYSDVVRTTVNPADSISCTASDSVMPTTFGTGMV
jgi:hypothetical protein